MAIDSLEPEHGAWVERIVLVATVPAGVIHGGKMEFHDPDREQAEAVEVGIERSPRGHSAAVGWAMVAAGIVGYLVIHLVQAVRYEFTDMFNVVFGLGFLLTTVVATAGVFVIVVQRWLLPELVAAIDASRGPETGDIPGESDA